MAEVVGKGGLGNGDDCVRQQGRMKQEGGRLLGRVCVRREDFCFPISQMSIPSIWVYASLGIFHGTQKLC